MYPLIFDIDFNKMLINIFAKMYVIKFVQNLYIDILVI